METQNRGHGKVSGRETPPTMLETPPLPTTTPLYVLLYVGIEKNTRGHENNPGGDDCGPFREKTPSIQLETRKRDTENNPGREMPPENMETPLLPEIPSFPRDGASRPRDGTVPRPPLAEFDGGFFSGGT